MTQIFNNGGQTLTTATDGAGSGLTVNVFIQWNNISFNEIKYHSMK